MTRTEQSRYSCSVAAVIAARNEAMTVGEIVEGAASYADKAYMLDGRSSDDTVAREQAVGTEIRAWSHDLQGFSATIVLSNVCGCYTLGTEDAAATWR